MAGIILIIFVILIAAFGWYISTRNGHFKYERSGLINSTPEKIFPYISHFGLGHLWSPYEKMDPTMKKTYYGADGEVGSIMVFDGNAKAGSGRLEILKMIPNQMVEIRLTMIKPFKGDNIVTYRLVKQDQSTQFIWTMEGDGGFIGKLMNVMIDCEKLVGDQFSSGIENLKIVVESA